ncbi:MAG: hypothetical protein ACK421_05090 [Pseudanabaenaceae cyanobacterium]
MSEAETTGIVKVEEKEKEGALKPSNKLPGNRPIGANGLQIANVYHIAGSDRPVASGNLQIVEYIGGNRPVLATSLKISEIYYGNRPVAPNTSEDSYTLMGFID